MNNKKWSRKAIHTLYDLSEIKKGCYKTYMVTYQLDDRTKVGVRLREKLM